MASRGQVVASAEEKEMIVYGEVDLDYIAEVRTNVPISRQKRLNVYTSAQLVSTRNNEGEC